jgi:hypothetical protein
MSEDRNKRVEQEIAEILERTDFDTPAPADQRRYRPSRKKFRLRSEGGLLGRVPSGIAWLIGIFGFALIAILVADWSRNLALLFAILSILVLLSPLYFWRRPAPMQQAPKEWRGRVIELPPRQDGPLGRLRYKLWEIRNRFR